MSPQPRAVVGALGSDLLEGRQTGLAYDVSSLAAVAFNTGIANLETADVILLVSAHLESGHYFNPHAQRIIDHLVCVCTNLVDIGALTNFWYFFNRREQVRRAGEDGLGHPGPGADAQELYAG